MTRLIRADRGPEKVTGQLCRSKLATGVRADLAFIGNEARSNRQVTS